MPKLYSPKEIGCLLKVTDDALRRRLRSSKPVVQINDRQVRLDVRRVNGRVYITEKCYNTLVTMLR